MEKKLKKMLISRRLYKFEDCDVIGYWLIIVVDSLIVSQKVRVTFYVTL